jgi:hypothetical protein
MVQSVRTAERDHKNLEIPCITVTFLRRVIHYLDLAFTPVILGSVNENRQILWIILPPQTREKLEELADDWGAFSAELGEEQMKRMKQEPFYQERILETAQAISDRIGTEPGWGNWPPDPYECLAVGMILGLWLERAFPNYFSVFRKKHYPRSRTNAGRVVSQLNTSSSSD